MQSEARREIVAPAVVLVLGLATILGAWSFQLIGGYVPCKLCLEQRVPYYVGLPLVLASLLAAPAGAKPTVVRMFLIIAALIFAYNVYLAVYQAGAEWAWWAGPTDCGGGTATTNSAADLLNSLKNIKVVSCTEASWRLFGLSFAGWNAVVSLVLVVVALWGAFRPLAPSLRPHAAE
jgi:disulfide bond formation protein DsbB